MNVRVRGTISVSSRGLDGVSCLGAAVLWMTADVQSRAMDEHATSRNLFWVTNIVRILWLRLSRLWDV